LGGPRGGGALGDGRAVSVEAGWGGGHHPKPETHVVGGLFTLPFDLSFPPDVDRAQRG